MRKAVLVFIVMMLLSGVQLNLGEEGESSPASIDEDPEYSTQSKEVSTRIPPVSTGARTTYDPITINNESDLMDLIDDEGWEGSGTESDPYLIKDLDIDGVSKKYCISIKNTESHVQFENLYLYKSIIISNFHSIKADNSSNITINNVEFNVTDVGVNLLDCHSISIMNSSFKAQYGIFANYQITGNISITNCSFFGYGFFGTTGVRMVGIQLVRVDKCSFLNDYGVYFTDCSDITVSQSSFNDCNRAIYADGVSDLYIQTNHFFDNSRSIELDDVNDLNISNAMFNRSSVWDISLTQCDDFQIDNTISTYNERTDGGLFFSYCRNGFVSDVILAGSNNGIVIQGLRDTIFSDLNITSTQASRVFDMESSENCSFFNSRIVAEDRYSLEIGHCSRIRFNDCYFESMASDTINLEYSIHCVFRYSEIVTPDDHFSIYVNFFSINNTFYNNRLSGMGFYLYMNEYNGYKEMIHQYISSNNTLNGKPIYHFNGYDFQHGNVPYGGQYFFVNCSNLTIKNWLYDNLTGLKFIQVRNVILNNLEITGSADLYSGLVIWKSSNITVENSSIYNNSRNGVNIQFSDNIFFSGNEVYQNSRENEVYRCVNTTFEKNNISGETSFEYVDGSTIVRNRFSGEVWFSGCDDIAILENDFSNLYSYFRLIINGCNGFQFTNNTMDPLHYRSLSIDNSKDGRISGNVVINGQAGYYIDDSNGIVLEEEDHQFSQVGTLITDSENVTIRNSIISSAGYGLSLDDCYLMNIQNNTIFECGIGLILSGTNDGGIISNNIIMDSEEYAIKIIEETQHVTIINNAFLRNNGATGYGFSYSRSQIYDETGLNFFYIERRGNHYSEFIEPDDDGDGIVDEPYVFQGVNDTDAYPLVRTPVQTFRSPTFETIKPGSGSIYLKWSQPEVIYGGPLSGYRLYMSENRGIYRIVREISMDHCTINNLEDGTTYSFMVSGFNNYGEGHLSMTVSGVPDSTPPELNILKPVDGSHTNRLDPYLSWTNTDPESEIVSLVLVIDHGNDIVLDLNWSTYPLDHLIEGPHTISMESRNSLGLRSWTSIQFTIDRFSPRLLFDHGDFYYSSDGKFDIRWDFEEGGQYLNQTFMIDFQGGSDLITGNQYDLTIEEDGYYFFTVSGWDLAGNKDTRSITLVRDSVNPTLAMNIEDGCYVTTDPLAIHYDIDGTGSPVGRFMITIDGSDPFIVHSDPHLLHGLDEGNHVMYVEAWDMAGNMVHETFNFMVDTINPKILIREPVEEKAPLDGIIFFLFSETVIIENVTINGEYQNFSLNENRLIIDPEDDWDLDTEYLVVIYGTDLAMNEIRDNRYFITTIGPGIITGIIFDSDGKPLRDVQITVGDNVFFSGYDGRFSITGQEGTHVIIFEKADLKPTELYVDFVNGNTTTIGYVSMEKIALEDPKPSPIIIPLILLVLILGGAGVYFLVFRKRKGLDHEDYDTMKEIMSGFGITRSPKEVNCYEILGVRRSARDMEIKKAYRSKAALYHPDKQIGKDRDESDKMRELNAAKSILLDQEKREVHDRMINHFR